MNVSELLATKKDFGDFVSFRILRDIKTIFAEHSSKNGKNKVIKLKKLVTL